MVRRLHFPGWGLVLAALACLSAACAKLPALPTPRPEPTRVSVNLNAAPNINVDGKGRSTPVVVRAYLLRNSSTFENADFFSLFERDRQVLSDVVIREEIAIKPGENRTLDFGEVEGGKAVAVFVAFRDIDRAEWRATVPVLANRNNQVVATLQDSRVKLTSSSSGFSLPLPVAKPSLPSIPGQVSVTPPSLPSVSVQTPSVQFPVSVSTPEVPTISVPASPVQVPSTITAPELPSVSLPTPDVPVSITTPEIPPVSLPEVSVPAAPSINVNAPALPFSIPGR